MGSGRYPAENEYDDYLTKHGGSSNAFTDLVGRVCGGERGSEGGGVREGRGEGGKGAGRGGEGGGGEGRSEGGEDDVCVRAGPWVP